MEKQSLLNFIIEFKNDSKKLYKSSDEAQKNTLKALKEFLKSEAVKEHFDGQNPEGYSEFDKELMTFIKAIIKVIEDNQTFDIYDEMLDSYSSFLRDLRKE